MGIMVYFLIMGNAGFCPSAVCVLTDDAVVLKHRMLWKCDADDTMTCANLKSTTSYTYILYTYTYGYVYIHTNIHTYIYIYIYTCMYVFICVYDYMYIDAVYVTACCRQSTSSPQAVVKKNPGA